MRRIEPGLLQQLRYLVLCGRWLGMTALNDIWRPCDEEGVVV